jgi:hypothetical protein
MLRVLSGNLSRGRPVYQSATYNGRDGHYAVDGNYSSMDPNSCATAIYNRSAYRIIIGNAFIFVTGHTWWLVDLGDVYAVLHVIMYNAAFLPGRSTFAASVLITCSALALSTVLRTTSLSYGNMPFSGTHPTKTP